VPLLAGAVYAGFLLVLNLLGGMGMGDVKLATALGLASWSLSVAVLSPVVAFLVGGVVSIVLLMTGKRGRRIAFGPFLLGGFWVAVTLEAVARFLMR
jgi:leader peptidase (prepilin peptidase)/N-methyltransferase